MRLRITGSADAFGQFDVVVEVLGGAVLEASPVIPLRERDGHTTPVRPVRFKERHHVEEVLGRLPTTRSWVTVNELGSAMREVVGGSNTDVVVYAGLKNGTLRGEKSAEGRFWMIGRESVEPFLLGLWRIEADEDG